MLPVTPRQARCLPQFRADDFMTVSRSRSQHPYFERLMMSRTNSVGQIIKAFMAVGTLIALACRFGVIKAALDNLCGLTSWTRDAVWPTQIADGLNWLRVLQIGLNFCRKIGRAHV